MKACSSVLGCPSWHSWCFTLIGCVTRMVNYRGPQLQLTLTCPSNSKHQISFAELPSNTSQQASTRLAHLQHISKDSHDCHIQQGMRKPVLQTFATSTVLSQHRYAPCMKQRTASPPRSGLADIKIHTSQITSSNNDSH